MMNQNTNLPGPLASNQTASTQEGDPERYRNYPRHMLDVSFGSIYVARLRANGPLGSRQTRFKSS